MTFIKTPKKLIEVALPLDAINVACAREKSIRHGHPSTLHLWWARRPLAAARAVIFAQMVNDPGYQQGGGFRYGVNKEKAAIERERLFKIIEDLVLWENTNNEVVLSAARAEIVRSWRETCELNRAHPQAAELFNPDKLPAFHDPFAGGGALPLEAQRLGLESYASDLNPVAVTINKAMIEIPPKFAGRHPVGPAPELKGKASQEMFSKQWQGAQGLAEDVRRYGAWMRTEAQKRIGHLYPQIEVTPELIATNARSTRTDGLNDVENLHNTGLAGLQVGQKLTVIAWLWARTVKSPNPAFSHVDVPLVSTFVLSSKAGKETYVHPVLEGDGYHFEVRTGKPPESAKGGTKSGGSGSAFLCLMSQSPMEFKYLREEAKAGRMGQRLMAVVAEGVRGRIYLSPTAFQEEIAHKAEPNWRPDTALPDRALGFRVQEYGMLEWGDLFTLRQLVALTTFSDLVPEAIVRVRADALAAGLTDDGRGLDAGGNGATAYAEAVGVYLGLAVSKMSDAQSSLCRWKPTMDQSIATFGRQALPMVWDYSEANAFCGMAGDFGVSLKNMMRVLDETLPFVSGHVSQADAQTQTTSASKVISTDPPYYDNIGYADLSDFFYVWLRKSLRPIFPALYATLAVPKAEELVATPYRHGGKTEAEVFFLDGLVADADTSGTSPGKAVLETLLSRYAPCVILIDELVAYVRQFEDGKTLTGGSFDSNLSFVQALTEALKAVPTAVLLASLPESDKEAGSQRGVKALASLSHYFGRIQALWKPVGTEEAFEIVRRRLFSTINDKLAAESVCRAFADYYTANSDDFPRETQESRYFDRLMRAYPIHPEVFDRLYEDWSTLDNFQRTRGVLKLMAKVIHRLWKDNDKDPLIMPGSFPLDDGETRNDLIYYLPQGWDPVVERDVDGERAETTEIENRDTRLGSVQACRRAARTIFLGSAPTTANQMVRGIELERIVLGVAQPGQQVGIYKDALRRLGDRLHYLNSGNNRFWFDTRPNLRREMEDRKRRFQDKEDVFPAIRERMQRGFASGVFGGTHIFTASGDVPDDWQLRLVVLPPDAAFSRSGQSLAITHAAGILKSRGDQPRFKQNRLIFLAADFDSVNRLKDQVRSTLAWQSIVSDIKEMKLNLDQYQSRQASASYEDANDALRRMVRETYKWMLAPMQEAKPGKGLSEIQWEHFQVNPGAPNLSQEIERVLRENELLITEWAPIHLAKVLRDWFWKNDVKDVNALNVWQQSCQQLYLPRIKDDTAFQHTMAMGTESRDFFGFAQGKENDRYVGFSFDQRTSLILDSDLLLIEPATAAGYAELQRAAEEAARPKSAVSAGYGAGDVVTPPRAEDSAEPAGTAFAGAKAAQSIKKQFYGSIELDAIQAKKQFADLVDEVVLQFTSRPGIKVRIAIEIEAESATGFDDNVQRAVKENCKVLRFKNAEFENPG